MSARNRILERVDAALADVPPGSAGAPVAREYLRTGPADLDMLVAYMREYNTNVHRVAPAELPAALAAITQRYEARTVAVPVDLPAAWLDGLGPAVRLISDGPGLSYQRLAEVDCSITACVTAVATTGGLAVNSGPRQGRRALSLVPDRHICVLFASQVVGTPAEALPLLTPDRPVVWIAGPSATADIELTRVEGAHGPRTLDLVLVEDAPRRDGEGG
ncbi:LUD domain-containing protein [Streptomyces sp. AV19]|uniref:LutC/YkgG family protein n=1 Tax=Streptomyces sp. AV19 TaxID=2793068 RepID=UPI0018FE9AE9|nr:LUD domain-containing protein [Streptomyces sp. AV19]MBH1937943.1 LUD domain-containing protein [Streptomyces sp. AV19]MDG4536882.1 LUD domain-containing protein [Streptomyces sp. AV19]